MPLRDDEITLFTVDYYSASDVPEGYEFDDYEFQQHINEYGAGRLFPCKSNEGHGPDADTVRRWGKESRAWGTGDIYWSYYKPMKLRRRRA